jgi:hypothetical protein
MEYHGEESLTTAAKRRYRAYLAGPDDMFTGCHYRAKHGTITNSVKLKMGA